MLVMYGCRSKIYYLINILLTVVLQGGLLRGRDIWCHVPETGAKPNVGED